MSPIANIPSLFVWKFYVLTGIVSSLMAQGYHAVEAAKSAVFIHGKASDQLAKSISQRGMISGDLLYKVGRVLQAYET